MNLLSLLIPLLVLGLFFLLLRLFYDRFWDRGLSCTLSFRDECAVEGERSALSEVIANDKLLPMPAVEIDFHMDRRLQFTDGQNSAVSDQTYRRDIFSLAFRQRITRTLEFDCRARGYFQIDAAGLNARDLFLTRKYMKSFPQRTDFYVLPKPVPVDRIRIPFSRIMGEQLSRRKVYDDPFAFAGLREYARGDPMKYINWKATARAGALLTNIHESTLSQKVLILLDMEDHGVPGEEHLCEAGVRIACSLCGLLLRAGVTLSVRSNGTDVQTEGPWAVESVTGAGSLPALRKKFACLRGGRDLPPILESFSGPEEARRDRPLPVLISGSCRQDLAEAFAALAGREPALQVIPYVLEHPEMEAAGGVELIWMEASPG